MMSASARKADVDQDVGLGPMVLKKGS
jgi:hypothetical protein